MMLLYIIPTNIIRLAYFVIMKTASISYQHNSFVINNHKNVNVSSRSEKTIRALRNSFAKFENLASNRPLDVVFLLSNEAIFDFLGKRR